MKWEREELFVLQCCRQLECVAGRSSLPEIPSVIDWHLFLLAASKEAVAPILFRMFSRFPKSSAIPAWLLLELKKEYYAVAARNAVVFDELGKILAAIHEAGHTVMVLKGVFLADKIFRDRGLRSMADVDLLVRKEDLAALDTVFCDNGYMSDDFCTIDPAAAPECYLTSVVYYSPSVHYFCFHIHWHIVNSSVPNQELIAQCNIEEIWNQAEPVVLAGQNTLVMAPYHLLIHLCEHGLRVTHALSRLSFLVDIAAAVTAYGEEMDWDKLVEKSREYKMDRFVSLSLALTVQLLDCPVPPAVLSRLRPTRVRFGEWLFTVLVSHNFRMPGLSFLLYLSNCDGVVRKLGCVFRTVFPPRQVMMQRWALSEKRSGGFLYLKRVWEITAALCTMVRRTLRYVL